MEIRRCRNEESQPRFSKVPTNAWKSQHSDFYLGVILSISSLYDPRSFAPSNIFSKPSLAANSGHSTR